MLTLLRSLPALVAGVAIGLVVGHWNGRSAGQELEAAKADRNTAQLELANTKTDLEAARLAASSSKTSADQNAAAAAAATERLEAYAKDLAGRAAADCGLTPDDLDRLRVNGWSLDRSAVDQAPPARR